MKKHFVLGVLSFFFLSAVRAQNTPPPYRTNVPIDSIRLSDPFILTDKKTATYYMTGTGGMLWKSKDLKTWSGPSSIAQTDPKSWMGPKPMIWAAEIHEYKGKYYYFATFTNKQLKAEGDLERRACHVLVSDKPEGPYVPMKQPTYLPANKLTLDATLWTDTDGKPYMVYCHEWLQNGDGTVEKIELLPDFSGTKGEPKLMFLASDSPWSKEKDKNDKDIPNKVTDGPWLFKTQTGKLGILWTSWIYDVYTQGMAYSKSGTLDGPWIQEKVPFTPPNHGHGMMFRSLDGKLLLVMHSHKSVNGKFIRIPKIFGIDDSGDKIVLGEQLF
ncbi:glycoside hydrolase [Dyadobacter luteus]|uniref:Glycoside hydrolase n=1 Tax=Dyadobacter luteus TaxID=2259619 RepID=A0A3D8Y8P9_9BACT|nr:glycoside hydrolase family 43 protein [Dyadobacter luteus]REA59688.1 glycoside hydrolase [Dyadobacter luteus]